MKYLVTGGAGFIGSHITEALLLEGHDVTVLDNFSTGRPDNLRSLKNADKINLIEVDISSLDAIAGHFKGVDAVFHLAALADIVPSIVKPMDYYQSNVTGTACVLEASRQAKVGKVVYAASSSCYGIPDAYPTPEEAEIRPQYPYALTKYLGEQCLMHWSLVYKLPVVSLRLFNVYGPRSRTSGTYGAVFGVFLAQKLSGKPYTVVGDGDQTRDFLFVKDVVRAFITAARSDLSREIINVGAGQTQTVNKLVELLGGDSVNIPKRPGEPDSTQADITKAGQLLGWEPKVSFEEGVGEMLKNIDYWRQAPVWTPESIGEATKDWFKYLGEGQGDKQHE